MNHMKEMNQGSTILLVDDVPANLDLLQQVLQIEGYRVLAATSGAGAMRILEKTQPDLILLDVMMPDQNGYETCRKIKSSIKTAAIPIIFVTAKTEIEALVAGFEAGAVDFITKPIYREEVIARVQTHLSINRLTRDLAKRSAELRKTSEALKSALADLQALKGVGPFCCRCHAMRCENGSWMSVEEYVRRHGGSEVGNGLICPTCKA